MSNLDLKTYEFEWRSLRYAIDVLYEDILKNRPQKKVAKQPQFQRLVHNLRRFANAHFGFFYHGFCEDWLHIDSKHPPQHVLRVILHQVSHDLDVIEKAWSQHKGLEARTAFRETLELADDLCDMYLKRFHKLLPAESIDDVEAVTYFQRSVSIRLIPYAPIALIGIPYTAIPDNANGSPLDDLRPMLSVPHEVGHYLFRHGQLDGKLLSHIVKEQLKAYPEWLENWADELFADVFGCYVGGPATAITIQQIVSDYAPDTFFDDDQEYPIPALRPDIHLTTIELLADLDSEKVRSAPLYQQWADIVETRFMERDGADIVGWQKEEAKLNKFRDILKEAVNTIVSILKKADSDHGDILHTINALESPSVILHKTERYIRDSLDKSAKRQTISTICESDPMAYHPEWLNIALEKDHARLNAPIPAKSWYKVWLAGGWTTEGGNTIVNSGGGYP